jgi:hypothetical protein
MATNLERFREDVTNLKRNGQRLRLSMKLSCFPEKYNAFFKERYGEKANEIIAGLPDFDSEYQRWYSEALALLEQLLPSRVADFARHYERPKNRKSLTNETYRIEDYLQGLSATLGLQKIAGPDAAVPHFEQQLAIVEAAEARFESSLFEIRQLVQADLFDSDLAAADELVEHKFARAAGALAGVVLEKHLSQVCSDHKIKVNKKKPTISDFNESLKAAGVTDVAQWRFVQHLADIRNKCDHARTPEPTVNEVRDLIAAVRKVTKTLH